MELVSPSPVDFTTMELTDLEAIIETGAHAFIGVGLALEEIRERKLYKETHDTFEEYCQERWGMSRQNASYQVLAAQVVRTLSTAVDKEHVPLNERQARPLAGLLDTPDDLVAVAERIDFTIVTPAGIKAAIVEVQGERLPKPKKVDQRANPPAPEIGQARRALAKVREKYGWVQYWQPVWDAIDEVSALRAGIDRVGVVVPVVKDQHGNIIDGHRRVCIAEELGIDYPVDVIEVADEEEALEIARTLNEDRRQDSKGDRLPVVVPPASEVNEAVSDR